MATYNIYGIGAALVDTEFEVNDDFLAQCNIDKGVMTLVAVSYTHLTLTTILLV